MTKFLALACGAAVLLAARPAVRLTDEQALAIGKRIWNNESKGTIDGLTDFDQGEGCDLGIGHFIWYPENLASLPFDESFPEFLAFLSRTGTAAPSWLKDAQRCPWRTAEEFKAERQSARMVELRAFLARTIGLQARFMADRMQASLPKMLAMLPPDQREPVRRQFERMARDPRGLYPLMDYVNFKGEGVFPTERYRGQGWGLLQVLQGMTGDAPGQPALDEFARSAEAALARRVRNSPPERHEEKWLPIWTRRIETYRRP